MTSNGRFSHGKLIDPRIETIKRVRVSNMVCVYTIGGQEVEFLDYEPTPTPLAAELAREWTPLGHHGTIPKGEARLVRKPEYTRENELLLRILELEDALELPDDTLLPET